MFRKKRKRRRYCEQKTEYGTAEGSLPRNRADAGSGRAGAAEKTTVLLCRISRLLERGLAKPQEILALTFSKAAAEEMKSRFENLNGASGVSFGTFHSIFFRILRSRYGWNVEQIFQEEERRNILRNSIEAEKWDIPI